jgi:Cu(I)/Ag(I) efflux system membrane fusion protein
MNRNSSRILDAGLITAVALLAAVGCSGGNVGDTGEMDGMDMDGVDAGSVDGMDVGGMEMAGMSADGSVRLSPADIGTFGITFGTAEDRTLSRSIRAVGSVEYDESRMTSVAPKFGGWVEELHADFTGRLVEAGEPLLEVYSPELVAAQEELLLAASLVDSVGPGRLPVVAEGARDLFASARRRLSLWDITDDQIDRLIETGVVRNTLTVFAPTTGVVMQKTVVEGQSFDPGETLFMIAELSAVWVTAELFETDAGLIREGMRAAVVVAALPGRSFPGVIDYVYPTVDDRTRSMSARLVVQNPDNRLKPGMYATVDIEVDLGTVLTLPSSAVLYTGERAVAFVDMGGGELMPHELQLGIRGAGFVEVISGVVQGARVVTSAQFLLDSESNLAEVMRAMMAQMNLSDMAEMEISRGGPPEPDTTGGS